MLGTSCCLCISKPFESWHLKMIFNNLFAFFLWFFHGINSCFGLIFLCWLCFKIQVFTSTKDEVWQLSHMFISWQNWPKTYALSLILPLLSLLLVLKKSGNLYLEEVNYFCKEPNSKYFRLCRPHGVFCGYSTPQLEYDSGQRQVNKEAWLL